MSFGEKIKKLRLDKNWTQEYVADKLSISIPALSRYESGTYEPKSLSMISDFAKLYGVTTDYLLGLDLNFDENAIEDVVQIPVYGKISAGQPLEMVENIIDYTYITAEQARKGSYFALEVNGDSMDKIIPNGSRVVVRKQEELENGEIGVIVVNGNDATVKRYERDEDNVYLYPESNNPEHKIQRYCLRETPVSILGKVESYNKKL